jgi:beta-mannanase
MRSTSPSPERHSATSSPKPTPSRNPSPSSSPRAVAAPAVVARVGVSLPLQKLDSFIAITGSVPSQLSIYQHWSSNAPFDQVAGLAAHRKGMSISVTWEPWAPECDCVDQPAWSDRMIAGGAHDDYIKMYARSIAAFGRAAGGTVTIRLAHEMNGNWYPWGVGVNGNTAADYVAMWRHVHGVFAAERVGNVTWMWAPNLEYHGATRMAATYPGYAYVDKVGLSGYNFGPGEYSSWRSFDDLYDPSLAKLRAIAPGKPLYVAEIACSSQGGDKAAWIRDMFVQIRKRPYIAGFVWFDQSPAARDWLIENDPASLAAWKAGIARLGDA